MNTSGAIDYFLAKFLKHTLQHTHVVHASSHAIICIIDSMC